MNQITLEINAYQLETLHHALLRQYATVQELLGATSAGMQQLRAGPATVNSSVPPAPAAGKAPPASELIPDTAPSAPAAASAESQTTQESAYG